MTPPLTPANFSFSTALICDNAVNGHIPLSTQIRQNRLHGFQDVGGRKLQFPIYLRPVAYITACTTVQAVTYRPMHNQLQQINRLKLNEMSLLSHPKKCDDCALRTCDYVSAKCAHLNSATDVRSAALVRSVGYPLDRMCE